MLSNDQYFVIHVYRTHGTLDRMFHRTSKVDKFFICAIAQILRRLSGTLVHLTRFIQSESVQMLRFKASWNPLFRYGRESDGQNKISVLMLTNDEIK